MRPLFQTGATLFAFFNHYVLLIFCGHNRWPPPGFRTWPSYSTVWHQLDKLDSPVIFQVCAHICGWLANQEKRRKEITGEDKVQLKKWKRSVDTDSQSAVYQRISKNLIVAIHAIIFTTIEPSNYYNVQRLGRFSNKDSWHDQWELWCQLGPGSHQAHVLLLGWMLFNRGTPNDQIISYHLNLPHDGT